MTKRQESPTTPILNLLQTDPAALDRYFKWMLCPLPSLTDPDSDPPHVRRNGETSVQYAQRVLGTQDYCATYLCRCWVWNGPTWRLYASRRGFSLEVKVPDSFDWNDRKAKLALATKALDDFLSRWYGGQG